MLTILNYHTQMLTAIECAKRGLTFAGVHDSFWTHARDVAQMNQILREEFVRMHHEDLLAKLYHELLHRHFSPRDLAWAERGKPGPPLRLPPARGTLDLTCVLDSPYFFS